MTEEKPATSPAPAAQPPKEIEVPLTSFVRGGMTTAAYDKQLHEKKVDAERRRAEEDARRKVTTLDPNARISTTKLGGTQSHACVVLEIRNSAGKAEGFIVCELTVDTTDESGKALMLIVCCPFCAARYGSAEAQMTIRSTHRHFELDTRRQGELWVNPNNPEEFYTLAGTIHLTEAVTCPGLGCGRKFRIDNSVLRYL
jgi:hypothetical protein